ncbi:MAG: serine--tRNA ligase, partial [Oscillospiraceae bacterium]|nr:serine--tRNA ligase [Oscillospiraceae bacterium]
MIDIKFLRENPDVVKENIKKKFQDNKLPLVDEVIELDAEYRKALQRKESLQADKNKVSKEIGGFMAKGMKDEADAAKAKVKEYSEELAQLDKTVPEMAERIKTIMMTIPNI